MGKYLDAIRRRREEIRQGRDQPVPVFKNDPEAGLAFQKKINELYYIESKISGKIKQTIAGMDQQRQDQFYERCVPENKRAEYTKEQFHNYVQNGKLDDNNGAIFGIDKNIADSVLDELLTEEENEALARSVLDQTHPADPKFPEELKTESPYKSAIDQQRSAIAADDPQYERKNRILDQAGQILVYGSSDYLGYLQRAYSQFTDPKIDGLETQMDSVSDLHTMNFLEKTLEGGKYKDKFPILTNQGLGKRYRCDEIDPSKSSMTEQDIQDLKKQKSNISAGLKNTVAGIIGKMDQIGEDKYKNKETVIQYENEDGSVRNIFKSEQGNKYYAFWPLVMAKIDLGNAIKKGDYDAAENAIQEYNRIKLHTDEIMKSVQTGASVFSGNLESTRYNSNPNGKQNGVPLEYLDDTVGHNKANGMFCLYAYCKSTDQKVEDVLEDPVGSLNKYAKKYLKTKGINTKGNTGKLLPKAFSLESALGMQINFSSQMRNFSRGMDTVSAMADSPEERERMCGLSQVAMGTSIYEIKKEKQLWEGLSTVDTEKQKMVYMHAALVPEEDFDLLDIAGKINKPDWAQQLDPNALIADLKANGKLDYGRIANQADHILEEARRQEEALEKQEANTEYNSIRFRIAAVKAYDLALKTASPDEMQTEGYRRLQEKSDELKKSAWKDVLETDDHIANDFDQLDQQIENLDRVKTGPFIDKTNSIEHQRMMSQLRRVQNKVKLLKGEDVTGITDQEREYLQNADLSAEIHKARNLTYDYYKIKTEKGTKDSFWYTAGLNRSTYAANSVKLLDDIEESMDIRDPARRMMDKAQLSLTLNEDGNARTDENVCRTAAKLMLGMMLVHQNKSEYEQASILNDDTKLEARISKIQRSQEFRHMMQTEGPKKIAEYIAEGNSKLTDAYIRACNERKKMAGQRGRSPNEMSEADKVQLWRQEGIKHEQQDGPVA